MNNTMNPARVQLFGRKACPLCDTARDLVAEICAEYGTNFEEIDVDTDPELRTEYGELVPVVLVDGKQVGFWRIDAERLRSALS